jgi:hypothetical protein
MRSRPSSAVDINVNVLTSGYWPTYPTVNVKLPAELGNHQVWHLSIWHFSPMPPAIPCICNPEPKP